MSKKKELKRLQAKIDELETQQWEREKYIRETAAYKVSAETVYVSGQSAADGFKQVLAKVFELNPDPTALTVTAQYIPPGVDGEASYFATTATASV